MEKSLPAQQRKDRAPDNNVRFGTGQSDGSVQVQGAVIPAGFIHGAYFATGDTVALIRQDKTWFCLGAVRTAHNGVHIQAGVSFIAAIAAPTGSTAITFDTPFAVTPTVTANINSQNVNIARWGIRATLISTTGFTLFYFSSDGANGTFSGLQAQWQAITPTQ